MTTLQPGTPLPETRRTRLLEALQSHGTMRISDLAAILGVSAVTVRRDVAQMADEGLIRRVHGGAMLAGASASPGEPEPNARDVDLRSGSGAIGMLVPSLDYYWPGVVRGAEAQARRLNLSALLRGSSYESDDDRAQIEHLLAQPGIEGLIIAPNLSAPGAQEMLNELAASRVPTVLVERQAAVPPNQQLMESVVSDHAAGAAAAVHHLVGLGHRRVGLVLNRHSPTGPHVHRGWMEASQALGLDTFSTIDARIDRRRSIDFDPEMARIVDDVVATGTTAMLVHADSEAIALVQHGQMRGLKVPEDLSIVAYDDEVADLYSPPLTAVRPPRDSIGRAAVDLLAARLSAPERPNHRVIISPRLNIRASTAPPRSRAGVHR